MGKLIFCALALIAAAAGQPSGIQQFGTYSGFELVSFNAENSEGGQLEVFQSPDLMSFFQERTTYNCASIVRDPSIAKYAGTYYLAHSGYCGGGGSTFGWSSSADGLVWANQSTINMASDVSGATNSWAPEWFIDPNVSGLSSVHLYVAVSTNGGGSFVIYEKHPTASDFSTWSTAAAVTITGESAPIDPFMVWRADLSKYCLWFKDNGSGYLNYACSSTLNGTFSDVRTDTDWMGFNAMQGATGTYEGPCLLHTVAGSPGTWRVFFDNDGDSFSAGQIWYSDSADGWDTWSTMHQIATDTQAKHGTVIVFP
jgi:hypothetical protein